MVTLLALAVLAQNGQIVLEARDKASESDVVKAARAFEKRCDAYGFEGVVAAAKGRQVTIRIPGTGGDDVRHRLEILAMIPGNKVEVRFPHPMTDGQRVQFGEFYGPKAMKDTKPPADAEWALSIAQGEREAGESLDRWLERCPAVAFSEPVKTKGPHLVAHKEATYWRYELNRQLLDELVRRRDAGKPADLHVVVDGYVVGWVKDVGEALPNGNLTVNVQGTYAAAILAAKLPEVLTAAK